jgi:uncharacterized protein (TIGR02266 family)
VRLWLEAVRRGTGTGDLLFDLRVLSLLTSESAEAILKVARAEDAASEDAEAPSELAASARRVATMLERALEGRTSTDGRRDRVVLGRVWTLFVPAYEEVCRVGRFVSAGKGQERSFPPLAMVAAHARARRRPTSLVPSHPPAPIAVSLPPTEIVTVGAGSGIEIVSVPPPARVVVPPPPLPLPPEPLPPPVAEPEAVEAREATLEAKEAAGEARTAPRRDVEVEVAICTESNFYLGFTENLSEGGVFVATYRPHPIGTPVALDLHLPIGSMRVSGIVRWLRGDDGEHWPGMGVQFEDVTAEDAAAIREFLTYREPLFFDEA